MHLDRNDADVKLIEKAVEIAIETLARAYEESYRTYGWHAASGINSLKADLRSLQRRHFNENE